jgi:hypothetical protein
MEPGKIEEQIRKRLEERSIEPSDSAWERLEQRLGKERKTTKPGRSWWYAVAAVFTGAVILLAVFNTNDTGPELVDTDKGVEELKEPNGVIPVDQQVVELSSAPVRKEEPLQRKLQQEVRELKNPEVGERSSAAPIAIRTREDKESKPLVENIDAEIKSVTAAEGTDQWDGVKTSNKLEADNDLFESKVGDVVAQVQSLEQQGEVTASEVDRLLREAQRELSNQRILYSSSGKINPRDLLSEVESELEQSFREKVFEALGQGFKKIRTAVVERNY